MKIITRIVLSIIFIVAFNIVVFKVILDYSNEQKIQQAQAEFVDSNWKLFHGINSMHENSSHIVASILARHPNIIQGYLEDNRSIIISETKKIWDMLHEQKNLIYEIHFFKPPGQSFVNFHDLTHYGQDVSAVRNDVLQTFNEQQSSEHFWICRLYPGSRSTYPIQYKDETIGVVSIGIHLSNYSQLFASSLNIKNMLIYKDDILKKRLNSSLYSDFIKGKTKFEDWIIDAEFGKQYLPEIGAIDFKAKQQRLSINNVEHVITSIPLLDKNEQLNAYLLLIKSLDGVVENNNLLQLIVYIFLIEMFLLLIITYVFVMIDVKRIYKLIAYLKNISQNKFANINNIAIKNDSNEISVLEKHVVQMASKLSLTFYKLSKNVEKFQFQAEHDALTGLLNRKAFDTFKMTQLSHIATNELAIFMLDIDHFKKINDSYGHLNGDIILQKVAEIILSMTRKNDLVFRYGGEEFCIILMNTSQSEAIATAEKIRKSISQYDIYINKNVNNDKSVKVNITISGGVVEHLNDTDNFNDLIESADMFLYQAKERGRNRIVSE